MTNYYFPIIYIVPLISVDGQASPRLFIALEIRHEKISYNNSDNYETGIKLLGDFPNSWSYNTGQIISWITDAFGPQYSARPIYNIIVQYEQNIVKYG